MVGATANEPSVIGYLTDDPTPEYQTGLTAAESIAELRIFLSGWPRLAPDAIAAARTLTADDWHEWHRGLLMERRRKFAGENWARRFAVILMPEAMVRATTTAEQFQVPWGVAWKRLEEEGLLWGTQP